MQKFSLLMLIVMSVGCGGASLTVPVSGTILLDGQPLKNASLHFVPQTGGRDATSTSDESGKFVMSTFEPRDGVVKGNYKVVVTPNIAVEETSFESADAAMAAATAAKPPKTASSSFPSAYTRVDQTPLTIEVPAPEPIVFDIKSN